MPDFEDIKVEIQDIDEAERAYRHYAPLLLAQGVAGLIAGILLLFWPGTGLAVAAITVGIFLVISGVERLVSVLRLPASGGQSDIWPLAGAVLRILIGVIILARPVDSGGVWASVIFILAGLSLVVSALFALFVASDFKTDFLTSGTALLLLLLGLVMILLPMVSALFLLRVLGGLLVLASVPALGVGLKIR